MPDSTRLSFGRRSLPLDIDAIVDDEAMSLAQAPIQFDFAYRGIRFACRCEQQDGGAMLKLVGDAGAMPFSAESSEARMAVQAIVEHANGTLAAAPGPAIRLTHGRILLGTERLLPMPITAVSLVAAIARFVVPALPYLTLLAEVVRPPLQPAKPGESALQPGWRRLKGGKR
jgi:hypothetical protein